MMYAASHDTIAEKAYTTTMRTINTTDLRKDLFKEIVRVSTSGTPIEILHHGDPVAIVMPCPNLPRTRRKPAIDLDSIASFCRRHHARSFALFGSILRDDFDERSDVDVLIDLAAEHLDFHEECRMVEELEALFGRKVDLVVKRDVESHLTNPHRRNSILNSAREIYREAA